MVINNRTYRGDLSPFNIYSAICAGYKNPPKACDEAPVALLNAQKEGISGNMLIAVVVLLVIVNLFLIILYRRCTNKEIKDDMQL